MAASTDRAPLGRMVVYFAIVSFVSSLLLIGVAAIAGMSLGSWAILAVELFSAAWAGRWMARRIGRSLRVGETCVFALGGWAFLMVLWFFCFLVLKTHAGEPVSVQTLLDLWGLGRGLSGPGAAIFPWIVALLHALTVFLYVVFAGWGARRELKLRRLLQPYET